MLRSRSGCELVFQRRSSSTLFPSTPPDNFLVLLLTVKHYYRGLASLCDRRPRFKHFSRPTIRACRTMRLRTSNDDRGSITSTL